MSGVPDGASVRDPAQAVDPLDMADTRTVDAAEPRTVDPADTVEPHKAAPADRAETPHHGTDSAGADDVAPSQTRRADPSQAEAPQSDADEARAEAGDRAEARADADSERHAGADSEGDSEDRDPAVRRAGSSRTAPSTPSFDAGALDAAAAELELDELPTETRAIDGPDLDVQAEAEVDEPLPPARPDGAPTRITLDEQLTLEVELRDGLIDVTLEGDTDAIDPLSDLGRDLDEELAEHGWNLGTFGERSRQGQARTALYRSRRALDAAETTESDTPSPTRRIRRGNVIDVLA